MVKIRAYKEGDENGFLRLDRLIEMHPWNRRDITNWNWKYKLGKLMCNYIVS